MKKSYKIFIGIPIVISLIGITIYLIGSYYLSQLFINPVYYKLGDDKYRVISVTPGGKNKYSLDIYLKGVENKPKYEIIDFIESFHKNRHVDSLYDMKWGIKKIDYVMDTLGQYRIVFCTKNAVEYEYIGMGEVPVAVKVKVLKDSLLCLDFRAFNNFDTCVDIRGNHLKELR